MPERHNNELKDNHEEKSMKLVIIICPFLLMLMQSLYLK